MLQVDEKACSTTHMIPDELRAMLETANALSPTCSIYKKKINVEFEDEEFTYDGQAHSIYVKSDFTGSFAGSL